MFAAINLLTPIGSQKICIQRIKVLKETIHQQQFVWETAIIIPGSKLNNYYEDDLQRIRGTKYTGYIYEKET